MNNRALVLATVLALGANAALAADGRENAAIRDNVTVSNTQLLSNRAAVAAPVKAQKADQPSYFDISERSNQN